jgi:cbb3-type cytochrome oxidase subunit 3
MIDWIQWFTRLEHSKPLALVLFFLVFCGILLYVYAGRERSERLESYKYLPLEDGDDDNDTRVDRKVN